MSNVNGNLQREDASIRTEYTLVVSGQYHDNSTLHCTWKVILNLHIGLNLVGYGYRFCN